MLLRHLAIVLACSTGCASLHEVPNKTDDVAVDAEADFKDAAYKQSSGLSAYQVGTAPGQGEWIACAAAKGTAHATVLLMHSDRAAYAPDRFCHGWHAQTFLGAGYDVLAINRPGFGRSTGSVDYGGPASIAAVQAVLPQALAAAKLPPVIGLWGYDSGAAAAALTAKQLKGLTFLLLGGGIYDYEETLRTTTEPRLKAAAQAIKALGDKAIEDRSVGYDPSGLPGIAVIYHGAMDTAAPTSQAKSFADSLASSGQVKVTYHPLENQGHDIPWVYHRHILEALLKDITKPAAHH